MKRNTHHIWDLRYQKSCGIVMMTSLSPNWSLNSGMEKKGGVCIIFLLYRVSTGALKITECLEYLYNSVEAKLSGRIRTVWKVKSPCVAHLFLISLFVTEDNSVALAKFVHLFWWHDQGLSISVKLNALYLTNSAYECHLLSKRKSVIRKLFSYLE